MNVHVLQHVPFEDIGSMADWFAARRARLSYTRFFDDPALPKTDGIDLVIAMGGPMSVNDDRELSWLVSEKEFVREAIRRGIPLLGICLGAQLIASALGARVFSNAQKEIGWFEIEGEPGEPGDFRFPGKARVFHWHGETFDLPAGARRLARSAACENQGFQIGSNVIGLQFHLETTPESCAALIEHCRRDLVPDANVQTEGELLSVPAAEYARINGLMSRVLDHLTSTR